MARKKRRRAPRRPSKFKRVMKIIGCVLLGIIFLGGAGSAGYFAAHQVEKARHPKKSPVGDADSLDEAGTLVQDMEKKDLGDGRILYSYGAPTEDGIYIVPYIIRSTTDGSVLFYVSVRHLGMTPQGFPGVDVMTDEETKYSFRPEAQQVTTETRTDGSGGVIEQFDEQVNAQTLKALKDIGSMGGAKIIFPREGGSNDDRMMTATECTQIEHMVELFDLWRQK